MVELLPYLMVGVIVVMIASCVCAFIIADKISARDDARFERYIESHGYRKCSSVRCQVTYDEMMK